MENESVTFPLDPGLPFLLWIEDVRATLPPETTFPYASTFHRIYQNGGLEQAVLWLELKIIHPSGKGTNPPSITNACNHYLIALMTLGMTNPATRTQTRQLIESRARYYSKEQTNDPTDN